MRKTMLSLALALVLCLALTLPAAAGDTARAGAYVTISGGHSHTGAVDQNGTLWMWGNNKYAQLGDPFTYDTKDWGGNYQSVPAKVLDDVVSVSCGREHTAAIKTDGSLWMWGSDSYGQIGVGGNVNSKGDIFTIQTTPKKVMDNVAAVSCGDDFTAAIKTDGSLWMWGDSYDGQLGIGRTGNTQTGSGYTYQNVPIKVMDNVTAVSCGESHTAIIKTDGSLWMCGNNARGQLGNGERSGNPGDIVKVMDGVTAVSCGSGHTAAVKTDGSLWTWGCGAFGQLGHGSSGSTDDGFGNLTQKDQLAPVKILDSVVAVNCGYDHTTAIKTDGSLWMWGSNYAGQFGNGGGGDAHNYDIVYQTSPVKVLDNVASVSCANDYTAVLKTDGSLWTCGTNSSGRLGNGGKGNFEISRYDNPCQNIFGKVMDNIKVPQNTGAVTPAPSVKTAQPTSDALTANGVLQNPTVYNIDGNNYFKIRDLAAILNGTEKQFSVGYDATLKSVTVTTGQSYDKLPTDLTGAPTGGSKTAVVSTDTIYIDGKKVDAQVYMIGGNNYFKLRDLGKALDFYVGWSQGRGVFIETDKPYQD